MRGQIIINISQGEKNFRATSPISMRCGNVVKKKHILHFFSTSRRVLVIDARLFGAIAASFYCPQFFRLSYGCVRLCCFHILMCLHHPVLWTTGRWIIEKYEVPSQIFIPIEIIVLILGNGRQIFSSLSSPSNMKWHVEIGVLFQDNNFAPRQQFCIQKLIVLLNEVMIWNCLHRRNKIKINSYPSIKKLKDTHTFVILSNFAPKYERTMFSLRF